MPDAGVRFANDGAEFGPLLRRLRLAARLSQEELAERARLSVVSISALERGRRRAPYRETLRLLGDALQLPSDLRQDFESAAKRRPLGMPGATDRVDPAVSSQSPLEIAQTTLPARHNMPNPQTRLIGRNDDVASLVRMFDHHRLVTLVGTGGIGKTRTALATGEALLQTASAGVWFIDLAPLARGSFVAPATAHALGVKESAGHPLNATLVAYLAGKDAILIFDNCEHVVGEVAALVDELLRTCERLRVLTTSRERLRIRGEQAYRLPSLSVPPRDAAVRLRATEAGTYSALTLFAERAAAIDHRFALDDTNTPIVAEICRLLDGIALAIELAAARVNILAPSALLERLDERFRILTGGERSALPRHQTMLALIDWSYDLLTAREQRLFERLAVFAGGCELSEAGAVCADGDEDEFAAIDVLLSLVDKSLVMIDAAGSEMRYRLLDSSRIYAAGKLREHADFERSARRHAATYLRLAQDLERDRTVAPDDEWLARAQPELENWRAALIWSFGPHGDVELGQRLVGALRPFWASQALAEGRRWLDAALERVSSQTPSEIALRLRFAAAHVTFALNEHAAALEQSVPLVAEFRAAGDVVTAAYAQYFAGGSLVSMGRLAEGEPLLEEALQTARAAGNLRLTGLLLEDIGYGKSVGSQPARGRVYLAEALHIWTIIGAKRNAANDAGVLAENHFLCGEVAVAIDLALQAVAKLRELRSVRTLVVTLNNLAAYYTAADRWAEARAAAGEALDLALETQANVATAWSLQHLAAIAVLEAAEMHASRTMFESAGRLLGYVDAALLALGSPRPLSEQREYDRVRAVLAAALGSDALAELLGAGTTLAAQHAVHLARSLEGFGRTMHVT